jgi:hypothetical protein
MVSLSLFELNAICWTLPEHVLNVKEHCNGCISIDGNKRSGVARDQRCNGITRSLSADAAMQQGAIR